MACDACSRSSPTVRPDSGCCPDTVVVTDGAACLPTTAAPASGRTVIHPKFAAANDIDVQECLGNGAGPPMSSLFVHIPTTDAVRVRAVYVLLT